MPEYYIHEERTASVRSDWLFRRELEKQDERGHGRAATSQPARAHGGNARLYPSLAVGVQKTGREKRHDTDRHKP
jgi:hypothetical protein